MRGAGRTSIPVERKAPKRVCVSFLTNPLTLLNPVYGACFLKKQLKKYCCIDIDFDILERQDDNLERQVDNSERRDDNGKDYGRRERPTAVLCLQLILLYKL